MIKKLEIIGKEVLDTYEEHETEINGKIVRNIDLSSFVCDRKIVLSDENRKVICEIYVPQTMLIKVNYM